jgi:hypothetical protein
MTFDEFIHDWKSARITAPERVDQDDQEYLVQRRANELHELALRRGFQSDLAIAARAYDGIAGFVRSMYRSVELQRSFVKYVPEEIVLKLPACVRLNGEMMAIVPAENGINKYAIRIEIEDGVFRQLTEDEEKAFAIAPGTRAERVNAAKRVAIPASGLRFALLPEPWRAGDLAIVVWQLERDEDE